MSKDLSGFVAEGIEFIIGGTVFLASVAFLLYAVGVLPVDNEIDPAHELGTAGAAFFFVAGAYAAGVIIEGASRLIFEWILNRMTQSTSEFQDPPEGGASKGVKGSLASCVAERERQRTFVMGRHSALSAEIGAQLKRLRLERVAFASALIVMVALLILQAWWASLVWLGVLCVLGLLVVQRLQRYCATIARTFLETTASEAETAA